MKLSYNFYVYEVNWLKTCNQMLKSIHELLFLKDAKNPFGLEDINVHDLDPWVTLTIISQYI